MPGLGRSNLTPRDPEPKQRYDDGRRRPRARCPPCGKAAGRSTYICVKDTSQQMLPATLKWQRSPFGPWRPGARENAKAHMDELESLPLALHVLDVCSLRLEILTQDTVEDFAYRAWAGWGLPNPALALTDANCVELGPLRGKQVAPSRRPLSSTLPIWTGAPKGSAERRGRFQRLLYPGPVEAEAVPEGRFLERRRRLEDSLLRRTCGGP